MPASNETVRIPHEQITVGTSRQRKEVNDIEVLADSIRRVGLLHPIVITRDRVLVAGERRLKAWSSIHLSESILGNISYATIPCHYLDQLDERELQIVELDENIRRKDITWQEQAAAVRTIHDLLTGASPVWSAQATADRLGLHSAGVSRYLNITEAAKTNDKLLAAPTVNSAVAMLKRQQDRQAQDVNNSIADLIRTGLDGELAEIMQEELPLGENINEPFSIGGPKQIPAADSILTGDCIKFMATYSGERFNLIHCDFPYGIDYDGWDGSAELIGGYHDTKETYLELLNALANFWDNIALPSSHLLFWFSMRHYTTTMKFFEERIPQLTVDEFPLIWNKTDNKGNLPDPNRGPRRTYETALFGYTGDRKIVKPVSNAYGAPTQRAQSIHISEKPEPVLRHFLSMVVDENTTLFDPTCGSATALRAAESLGAKRVLGLELNEEYANASRKRLDDARTLRQLDK